MHPFFRRNGTRFLTSFLAAILLASPASAETRAIHVTHPLHYGTITIDARLPLALDPLPFFQLSPITPPTGFVSELLNEVPYFPLVQHDQLLIATDGQVVRAFVDPQSGDATFVPDLNRPHNSTVTVSASSVASEMLDAQHLIPDDATHYRLSNEIPVFGSASQRHPGDTSQVSLLHPKQLEFTFVAVQRYAAGHPVYGKGSRMVLSISPQGKVVGLLRRWRSAERSTTMTPITPHPAQIIAQIREQLQPYIDTNAIDVDSIEEAYYDNNEHYLQPVLRYTAVLKPLRGDLPPAHIYGFLPLCNVHEPIPVLDANQVGDEPPMTPQRPLPSQPSPQLFVQEDRANVNDLGVKNPPITLGEYANRDSTMLDMATDFRNGINGTLGTEHIGTNIDRTQWYWAEPWEVTSVGAQSFLNSVDIAYTQPYGDWYRSTTISNDGDMWQIGTGDVHLGAAAKGRLATWIIDASNVVPSYDDVTANGQDGTEAFTPWFSVFYGLHNVVGFRTQMWLHDGLNVPFSQAAGLGLDINASWFQEIAADSNYNGDAAYYEPHLKRYVHFGRASVFVDARNCGHSIYDTQAQTRASVLWNFWMGD